MYYILQLLCLALLAQAHMEMSYPPPFRSKFNKYTTSVDYDMTSPLSADGSNYPCKGYQSLYNSPQGRSVATWQAGSTHNFTIVGGATHGGGSCQASLSFDQGRTWKVVHSYIGKCPLMTAWTFTLPNDTPAGDALFAWSWFNQIGNREMYMNCARVTITGRSPRRSVEERREEVQQEQPRQEEARSPSDPISSRPAIFVANVNNGCGTLEGADVLFPHPGPDVDNASAKTAKPVGSRCG